MSRARSRSQTCPLCLLLPSWRSCICHVVEACRQQNRPVGQRSCPIHSRQGHSWAASWPHGHGRQQSGYTAHPSPGSCGRAIAVPSRSRPRCQECRCCPVYRQPYTGQQRLRGSACRQTSSGRWRLPTWWYIAAGRRRRAILPSRRGAVLPLWGGSLLCRPSGGKSL